MHPVYKDQKLTFACPQCGKGHALPLAGIKREENFRCGCGAVFPLDGLVRAVEGASDQISDFTKDLSKLFK